MANYFYIDTFGQTQGPINAQQLQALATHGIITPETPLETDGGHKGMAGQIPGLKFSPKTGGGSGGIRVPNGGLTYMSQFKFDSDTERTSIVAQLRDFSFRELCPESLFLLIVKILYAITVLAGVLTVVLTLLGAIISLFVGEFAAAGISFVVGIIMCILIPLYLVLVRFSWELTIIIFHYSIQWLIGFAKLPHAICMYLEEKSKQ